MKVIVCLKEVLDPKISLDFGLENPVVWGEGIPFKLNPADALALTLALKLKAEEPAVEITAVAIGGKGVERYLRLAVAAGADKALRIRDDAGKRLLPHLKARFLAAAARLAGAALVLCGAQSLDTANGQVGGLMAGMLGFPCLSGVVGFEYEKDSGRIVAIRDLGAGQREKLASFLPAVITVKGQAELPYASLDRLLESEDLLIPRVSPAELGITPAELADEPIRFHRLTFPKPPLRRLPPLDCSLPAYYRILQLIEGGMAKRKAETLAGSPAELAGKLFGLLKESGIFRLPLHHEPDELVR